VRVQEPPSVRLQVVGSEAEGRQGRLPAAPQHVVDPGQQFPGLVGFVQAVVGPQFQSRDPILPAAGHDDDREVLEQQFPGQFQTIPIREIQIQQHQIRSALPQQVTALGKGFRLQHQEAVLAQIGGQQQPLRGIVLNEKDAGLGFQGYLSEDSIRVDITLSPDLPPVNIHAVFLSRFSAAWSA